MKFTSLLTNLIFESSRFEILYDKMVKPQGKPEIGDKKSKSLMDFATLKNIIFADPTTKAPEGFNVENATEQDMNSVKVGKYVQWLLRKFTTPKMSELNLSGDVDPKSSEYKTAKKEYERLFLEDLFKQTERLQFYEKAKPYLPVEQRNIDSLSINDLFDIFANFEIPEKKKIEAEKKEAKKTREGFKHAGGEIIFQGNKWTLIRISDTGPVGKDAAIYYGGFKDYKNGDESDWCTSAPGLTYFEGYIKDGPLYVIFPNDDKGQVGKRTGLPKERYQFHFPSNQFMDRHDKQIGLVEMLNGEMSELKEVLRPEFAKGLTTKGGTTLSVEYPKDSVAKYIALYGFVDLFDALPDTLIKLDVTNKSNENLALDIPNSISRFKNLETMMFKNIVKTIPDSVCELKNLNIIGLPDNKELKSIPDCLADLPDLAFINIMNSPNVKLSNDFLGKFSTFDERGIYAK